jgi:hypothetical protein
VGDGRSGGGGVKIFSQAVWNSQKCHQEHIVSLIFYRKLHKINFILEKKLFATCNFKMFFKLYIFVGIFNFGHLDLNFIKVLEVTLFPSHSYTVGLI